MYAKVLYDNRAKKGLLSGIGFSCLIDGKILFDTGEASHSLVENMDRLMVSPKELDSVVISHDHWDHTGGLWEVLKKRKGLKVFACPSFSDTFKKCVKESGGKLCYTAKFKKIAENVYVTGEIMTEYKGGKIAEQALIIKGDKGVSVVTGCAHPGIVKIVKAVKKRFKVSKIYMVFGGFHLEGLDRDKITGIISDLKDLGVVKVGPTHCSGEKARRMFSGQYHENYIAVKAGHIIHL
ncbi:MAG: MBL fold metallo-hydrolase [Candidatus Omnitrophota bacterium]|nr:MBL fold metallo-hydrolase [Candidatus Omnitrophota bacterium]